MPFEKYCSIIQSANTKLELLQIEGGEPVLHPEFTNIVDYAFDCGVVDEVSVLTNGVEFEDAAKYLKYKSESCGIPVTIKVSLNYYLDSFKGHFESVRKLVMENQESNMFKIIGNVRFRNGKDEKLIDRIKKDEVLSKICKDRIYPLQHYGLAKDESEYGDIIIVCQDLDWHVFSCDGTDFGKDLVARSEHEGRMSFRK